jgi:hypothetical protein
MLRFMGVLALLGEGGGRAGFAGSKFYGRSESAGGSPFPQ